ncbi:glycerophosphodiester phosphodiesterase family protein [Paenactinomyces guangxiensis]|uniref:GP-PDE domain-containing protein n=1 Tax=Paenactinomyces guangxiensis TaxID=1490290 RepID=A0A7W1WS79_9BACL|nr:glycerophosphodiester phosphodiesterase family protein [Paenactinomyces guangxiensis]MBA4495037.1 hypothetical protein [Paenactinomyces guangxiensis]MBH8592121.1 hypothetical protein [Paenactinomyces guangxiensis]
MKNLFLLIFASVIALTSSPAFYLVGHASPTAEQTIVNEDFSSGTIPADWKAIVGEWKVQNGRLVGKSDSTGQLSRIAFGPHVENFRFEATIRFDQVLEPTRWTALALDMPSSNTVPWSQAALRSGSTASNGVEFAQRTTENKWNVISKTSAPREVGVGKDVRVRIEVHENLARWYFDDRFLLEETFLPRSSNGVFGFVVSGATVSFDNVKITQLEPKPPVLKETFSGTSIPSGWNPSGSWTVQNGRLIGKSTSTSDLSRISFGSHLKNFRFEATVRFDQVIDQTRWAALALDMPKTNTVPWSQAAMRSGTTASNGIEFAQRTSSNNWNVISKAAASTDAGVGKDVRVAIEVQDKRARWYYNGQFVLEETSLPRSSDGVFGFVISGATVSFDDVIIRSLGDYPSLFKNTYGNPHVVAHRGNSVAAPENTIAAIRSAKNAGVPIVEVDTQTTYDGVPILMHDKTVDRTTNGTGYVNEMNLTEIRMLDAGSWFSPQFAGERVPTLEEALDEIKDSNIKLLLEIKAPETQTEIKRILFEVTSREMSDQVIIQSFDETILRYARSLAPEIPRAILRTTPHTDPVAAAKDLGLISYHAKHTGLSENPGVIKTLHQAGFSVFTYTIDTSTEWGKFTNLGVDGIVTNHPKAALDWLSNGFPGTVNTTTGVNLNVRSGPGTNYDIVGSVADGQTIFIKCQIRGETITGTYGTSNLWNQIGDGKYIPDAYTYTGSSEQVAPTCTN